MKAQDVLDSESGRGSTVTNLQDMSVEALVGYIIERHHNPTIKVLGELGPLIDKLHMVHGVRHPELGKLRKVFANLRGNLLEHFSEEENVWFPHLIRVAKRSPIVSKYNCCDPRYEFSPEHQLTHEHEAVDEIVRELKAVTNNFAVPVDGCATYAKVFRMLNELCQDLEIHIQVENNVLLQKIKRLEEQRLRGN